MTKHHRKKTDLLDRRGPAARATAAKMRSIVASAAEAYGTGDATTTDQLVGSALTEHWLALASDIATAPEVPLAELLARLDAHLADALIQTTLMILSAVSVAAHTTRHIAGAREVSARQVLEDLATVQGAAF